MSRYSGKNAIVTGGSTGIGLATAELLIAEGARVLITGRNEKTLAAAKERLGEGASVLTSDTSSLADIDVLAQEARRQFDGIDFLFINAGIAKFAPIEQVTVELFDDTLGINAKGALFTVQKLLPQLRRGAGIVLNTSAVDELGLPNTSVYAASKAALRSLARTLSTELLPRGIRVNAVSPGPVETPIMDKAGMDAAGREGFRLMNPMKRFGEPAEVGRAALFLGFDATYTTGAELPVDGGFGQL
ncbi:MAG TPA: SDR family oxidoreductase [Polyangiales bacterium]|nr:SDR family oxidoreductase [Polyangiales bacterium]